ncbi:hypothetical protein RND81_01G185200 [Saponaria officinalis]|uniref:Uncharacterized protein n=1 Tax=Saponaria officinalis TaxID=3572 RepID=A0AAW1N8K7_SAPOF
MEDDSYRFLRPQSVKKQFNPEFQPNPRKKSMSFSQFVMKFVVIALFLCIIPLFPSEPPEFITDTVFAKMWELIHLLVIGIALSYGLFCRRKNPEQNPLKSQHYQQYNASVLHYSSFCDGRDENPPVEFGKNGVKNGSYEFSGFGNESYVVVRQGCGEKIGEKPLGLPVRSLRSRVLESDSENECGSECDDECCGESSCSKSSSLSRGEKGEDFDGIVGGNSFSNRWGSRSMRDGGFEIHGENGEKFVGVMGRNGWESRSMRAGFVVEKGDLGEHCGKGENLERNVEGNGFSNRWDSRSKRDGGFEVHGEKGENLERNVEGNGFSNRWDSRSKRDGGFEVHGEKGENFEGIVGSNGFRNGWESRGMGAGFAVEKGDLEVHCGKGENLEGNGFLNRWNSRSMRDGFMEGDGGFEIHGEKGDIFEGVMGSNGVRNGCGSRSMRTGFVAEKGDFENFEGNVGSNGFQNGWDTKAGFGAEKGDFEGSGGGNVLLNGWNPRSMMSGFKVGNADFELASKKGENLVGNEGGSAAQNGWHSRSVRTGFMAGTSTDFELHCGKGDNFDGNVGSNVFPNEWKSRSMRTDFMADGENVELTSWKGENLEGNVGNYPSISRKSRSMRSDFVVNEGTFESELSKPQASMSQVQGASCGMNPGFCSWLPESPNMVTNARFPNFHTRVNDFNLAGSTPTLENFTTPSNFFMPSTTTPPSVTVSTSDFASGSMMYNYENCNWGTSPILESENKFDGNSALFMPSENDVGQPTYGSSPKKNEENFMPQTPEAPPSVACPSADLGSSVRKSKRSKSKLGLSGKKSKQQSERDASASRVVSPVTVPTPVDDVALPTNGSFPNKSKDFFVSIASNGKKTSVDSGSSIGNADFFIPEGAGLPSIPAPNDEPASFGKSSTSPNLNHGTLHKTDNVVMPEIDNETLKHDVIAQSTKGSIPEKWDEDCFVIPLSENNDTEDVVQVVQDDPAPELTCLSDVASSSSQMPHDEQRSDSSEQINEAEEDVELKGTTNFSEIETFKPSTPSPPPQVQIRARGSDPEIPSSVESSSRAHSDRFLIDERHDNEEGSPLTPKRGKSLSKASDSRGFSCTSFFDRDLRRSFRNEAREENRTSEGDQYVGRTGKCSCLSLDVRPTLSKAALKGKSVRTIRPREVVPEKREDAAGKKEQSSEMVLIKIGISEKRSSSNGRKREKNGNAETSIIVGVNSDGGDTSTKAAVLCDVKEDKSDSEIDKKADEFIAKFKEQIRLQKVSAGTASSRRQLPRRNSLYRT